MAEAIRPSPYPSATPSPYPSRHTSGSPSPSSSFLGDRVLLLSRKHTIPFVLVSGRPCCGHSLRNRSSSLDDVRSLRNSSAGSGSKHRRSASARSSRRRKESVYSDGRRASRRPSTSIDRSRCALFYSYMFIYSSRMQLFNQVNLFI